MFSGEEGEEWEVKEICGNRKGDDGVLELLVKWKSSKQAWELYEGVAQTDAEALDTYDRLHGQATVGTV